MRPHVWVNLRSWFIGVEITPFHVHVQLGPLVLHWPRIDREGVR